jgi:hypothetical protein
MDDMHRSFSIIIVSLFFSKCMGSFESSNSLDCYLTASIVVTLQLQNPVVCEMEL